MSCCIIDPSFFWLDENPWQEEKKTGACEKIDMVVGRGERLKSGHGLGALELVGWVRDTSRLVVVIASVRCSVEYPVQRPNAFETVWSPEMNEDPIMEKFIGVGIVGFYPVVVTWCISPLH